MCADGVPGGPYFARSSTTGSADDRQAGRRADGRTGGAARPRPAAHLREVAQTAAARPASRAAASSSTDRRLQNANRTSDRYPGA